MKRLSGAALIVAVALSAGCSVTPSPSASPPTPTPRTSPTPLATAPTATPAPDPWAHLFRPLQLPSAERDDCPSTVSASELENIGPILGDGPIYPAFLGTEGRFGVRFDDESVEPVTVDGTQWWGKKTLWLSDDAYKDIALVRGGRIDAPGGLLFYPGDGPDMTSDMRLTREGWVSGGSPAGWREWNSGVFFAAPGCYAFQIDGQDFTDTVVVEVLPQGGE